MSPLRLAALAAAGLAFVAALLLALFDWATALVLIGSLALGWALVIGSALLRALYRRNRSYVLGAAGVVVVLLLVVLRPGGGGDDEETTPMAVTSYGAELWTNRLAAAPSFIVRERIVRPAADGAEGAAAVDGRANVDAIATGPLMREVRFVPGTGIAGGSLSLDEGGQANVIVNPIEGGVIHHARGAALASVELPIGDVVTATYGELPREVRIAYLVGAGRALAPLAALVTPLRRQPGALIAVIFAVLGAWLALAWSDVLVAPLVGRVGRKLPPARKPGTPGAPIERAPLVPRRS